MQKQPDRLYDIGDLKNRPEALYDTAVKFSAFLDSCPFECAVEIWQVLERVSKSLWGNLPPVVVIDFRDPDDPATWGDCGAPPGFVLSD